MAFEVVWSGDLAGPRGGELLPPRSQRISFVLHDVNELEARAAKWRPPTSNEIRGKSRVVNLPEGVVWRAADRPSGGRALVLWNSMGDEVWSIARCVELLKAQGSKAPIPLLRMSVKRGYFSWEHRYA